MKVRGERMEMGPNVDRSAGNMDIALRSMEEFRTLLDKNYSIFGTEDAVYAVGYRIAEVGCREPLTGRIIPPCALSTANGLREGLGFEGIASRVRAVMLCIEEVIAKQHLTSPRIFAAEGLTSFALRLRGIYPRFLGSEYTTHPERKDWMYPIPCEDLQNLSLPDAAFDIVSTNEVLEHVPSIDLALAEIARVLRPGGWHIGTVPFHYFNDGGERRAMLDALGSLVHLLEPQYHGDPMNDGGALVFEIPGWDILKRARRAGFRDAFMRFIVNEPHGIVSEHIGGVLVFCCEK